MPLALWTASFLIALYGLLHAGIYGSGRRDNDVDVRISFNRCFLSTYQTLSDGIHSDYLQGNEDEEDLGGIKVSRALLLLLDMGPTKSPTVYARELLRLVFSSEELVGKSITGKQSNAHKDKPAKPQLDPVRVNAVISEYEYLQVLL